MNARMEIVRKAASVAHNNNFKRCASKVGIERSDHGRGHHEQGEDGRYLTRTLAGDDIRTDQNKTKKHDGEHGQQLLENDTYQSGAALLSCAKANFQFFTVPT